MLDNRAAMVAFSGGQDSTTCLAWALDQFERVETVGINYGQRHAVELECRRKLRAEIGSIVPAWRSRLGDDTMLDMQFIRDIGGTAMTEKVAIELHQNGLPNTFVPGRNLLFITAVAACAYRKGIRHIVTGVCETDYSGYPDCRDDTMKALQVAISLGMQERFVLHTPLMWKDKAATWELARSLGGQAFVDLVIEDTHTCYVGNRSDRYPWGYGCGDCPACQLRARGYEAFLTQRSAERPGA